MTANHWYTTFFGEEYLQLFEPFLGPERTKKEIEGVCRLLGISKQSTVLDLCCGYGRHSIPLAQAGYTVTGVDINETYLKRARHQAQQAGISATFLQGDMRRIPYADTFDAVVNLFNSFGYFENKTEDMHVLRAVYQSLRHEGVFLQEVANVYAVVRQYQGPRTVEYKEFTLVESKEFDVKRARINVDYTISFRSGKTPLRMFHTLQTYTPRELVEMHEQSGFRVVGCLGSLQGDALTLDSDHVVLLSKKVTG